MNTALNRKQIAWRIAQEIKEGEDKTLPRALSSCITASPNQVKLFTFFFVTLTGNH